jgi:hypothetical protein
MIEIPQKQKLMIRPKKICKSWEIQSRKLKFPPLDQSLCPEEKEIIPTCFKVVKKTGRVRIVREENLISFLASCYYRYF